LSSIRPVSWYMGRNGLRFPGRVVVDDVYGSRPMHNPAEPHHPTLASRESEAIDERHELLGQSLLPIFPHRDNF